MAPVSFNTGGVAWIQKWATVPGERHGSKSRPRYRGHGTGLKHSAGSGGDCEQVTHAALSVRVRVEARAGKSENE